VRQFVTIFLLSLALAGVAIAQTPDRRKQLSTWLGQLADPNPTVRANAQQELMGISANELPLLREVVVAATPLRLMQVDPLREAVEHIHLRAAMLRLPKDASGFLGITLPKFGVDDLDGRPLGVPVVSTLPGFVASRLLQPGDVILSMGSNGQTQETLTPDQLRLFIRSIKPGELITVRLIRGRQVLTVQFPLDAAPMRDPNQPDDILFTIEGLKVDAADYYQRNFATIPGMPKEDPIPDELTE
jgi:hypothetical protein